MPESLSPTLSPEYIDEEQKALLQRIQVRLESLGPHAFEVSPRTVVNFNEDSMCVMEAIDGFHSFEELLVLPTGDEQPYYEANLYGEGEISERTISLIEQIERELNIDLYNPRLTKQALERLYGYLQ
ncbi:MAG: hypothetical protein Q8P45_00405 [Candidatus Harrisonbacteria bacterium]|nr:hypothetical protein [Candidatus Harrisonbacteria bacterium]